MKLVSSGKNKAQNTTNGRAGVQSSNTQSAVNIPQQRYTAPPAQNPPVQSRHIQNPSVQNSSVQNNIVPGVQYTPQSRSNSVNQQSVPYQQNIPFQNNNVVGVSLFISSVILSFPRSNCCIYTPSFYLRPDMGVFLH